jgi:hypothetical protein
MDVNHMITSSVSSVTSSNSNASSLHSFTKALDLADKTLNSINELKNNFTSKSKDKKSKSKTNESNDTNNTNKSNESKTNNIQISSSIKRKIAYINAMIPYLTSKKQIKILNILLDQLFMKIQMLANNDLDILADDE